MYEIIKCGTMYGVRGEGIVIEDLFPSLGETSVFIFMINRYEASPEHVYDIIEDYFGRFGFMEQLFAR